jgi:choline dehydrogenase-like flavoprotein
MASREEFDVCVIGTGAGGGVLIDQLTAAGFRVVALQRGPHLRTKDFVDDDDLKIVLRDELFSPDQLETWRLDENSPTESGRFNSVAHCVGGTMVHWSAWSWRFRPDEFRVLSEEGPVEGASLADWPIDYEEMEPYYERAEWAPESSSPGPERQPSVQGGRQEAGLSSLPHPDGDQLPTLRRPARLHLRRRVRRLRLPDRRQGDDVRRVAPQSPAHGPAGPAPELARLRDRGRKGRAGPERPLHRADVGRGARSLGPPCC